MARSSTRHIPRAIIGVEGYAPLVLDDVEVAASQIEPYRAALQRGTALLVFEIPDTRAPGTLRVRDLARDRVLVKALVRPSLSERPSVIERRLQPSDYEAVFESENGPTWTSRFEVELASRYDPLRVRLSPEPSRPRSE